MMLQIRRIIYAYFSRLHTSEVYKSFIGWFTEERFVKEKEAVLREVWDEMNIAPDLTTEASYLKLRQRLFPEAGSCSQPKSTSLFYGKWLRVASMLLIPLLSVAGAYVYVKMATPATPPVEMVECFVGNGEIREITLPDSSVVLLNSGSILIYPKTFSGSTRDLYLNGEALFSVTHNSARPFVVKTACMDVEVLGTVFNLSSYNTNKRVKTTLETGKVNVRLKNANNELFALAPDEQLSFDRKTKEVVVRKVDVEKVKAWKDGVLSVENQSLHEVARMLERRFDVKVNLVSGKYDQQHVTAKFGMRESLRESLTVLQQLIPEMNYRIEEEKVYIY